MLRLTLLALTLLADLLLPLRVQAAAAPEALQLPVISGVVSLVVALEVKTGAGCTVVVTTRLEEVGVVEFPAASVE